MSHIREVLGAVTWVLCEQETQDHQQKLSLEVSDILNPLLQVRPPISKLPKAGVKGGSESSAGNKEEETQECLLETCG